MQAIWRGGGDRLVCAAIRDEAPGVKTFRFVPASGSRIVFDPGQFLTIAVPLGDEAAWRSFTIASSPLRGDGVDLTIKAQAGGRATRWLHDSLAPGMSLESRPPAGSFRLAAAPDRPLVLVSAGSGATPMAAILRWLADRDLRVPVHHVHVGRTREDLLFREELTDLAHRIGTWRLDWIVTRGAPEPGILAGRPEAGFWTTLIPSLRDAEVFACGPGAFMSAVAAAHRTTGAATARFHQESFGTEAPTAAPPAVLPSEAAGAEQLARFLPSGREAMVRSGESLLDAALRVGVRIPNSCRQGICGTCRVRKVSGEVSMTHAGGISDEEIADGDILACCAHPQGPVTLKVS
ncbi:flavin reductase family protein [Methylobacterium organophilum]|nr:iron-sulfur cluster-binding domain-containing protein [Methylobacterium organophilum]UMY16760.1 iron-sulfur cluster-binding domain-containing protein [Methylobacterium organophilum]